MSNEPFPQEAFPLLARTQQEPSSVGIADSEQVRVNIYFQATRNMLDLLETEGSVYAQALEAVLRVPGNWGTNRHVLNTFRFDVQNQEPIRAIQEFAYPLYPDQVHGSYQDGVRIHGIFEPEFYSFDWYLHQAGRAQTSFGIVRDRLQHYPQNYITYVINEISALRTNPREISVIVTNLRGNPNEQSYLIFSALTQYLMSGADNAVATVAIYNSGNPFYVLILGSGREVAQFSYWLNQSITAMNPRLGFFTTGQIVERISTNQDIQQVRDTYGARLALDRDIQHGERGLHNRELFNRMGTPLYYTLWSRQMGEVAHFNFDIELNLVNIPFEMIEISPVARLYWLSDGEMMQVGSTSEYVQIYTGQQLHSGVLSVNVFADMGVFAQITTPPIQAVMVVELYASLSPIAQLQPEQNFPHELFVQVTDQFIRDIQIRSYSQQVAEIYVHFIYR